MTDRLAKHFTDDSQKIIKLFFNSSTAAVMSNFMKCHYAAHAFSLVLLPSCGKIKEELK